MHSQHAKARLRVIEKYVFTVYAGIHERLDIFAVVDQAAYDARKGGARDPGISFEFGSTILLKLDHLHTSQHTHHPCS